MITLRRAGSPAKASGRWKIASFAPAQASTCVSGSTATPKRRRRYPAAARLSALVPKALGYCETSGTPARSASLTNPGVGSFGSPRPKSKSRLPPATSARRRSSSSTMRFFWTSPRTGFFGAFRTGSAKNNRSAEGHPLYVDPHAPVRRRGHRLGTRRRERRHHGGLRGEEGRARGEGGGAGGRLR